MTKTELRILEYIYDKSLIHGIYLDIQSTYIAPYQGKPYSAGYFTSPDMGDFPKHPRITVAIGERPPKEWIGILLHEYCHFTQWLEQCDEWKAYLKNWRGIMREWEMSIVKLELDCEKRTLELIKKLEIEHYIKPEEYIKNSNAYLGFYHIYFETGIWYKKSPYSFKEILDKMPTKSMSFEDLEPDEELKKLYLKHCY